MHVCMSSRKCGTWRACKWMLSYTLVVTVWKYCRYSLENYLKQHSTQFYSSTVPSTTVPYLYLNQQFQDAKTRLFLEDEVLQSSWCNAVAASSSSSSFPLDLTLYVALKNQVLQSECSSAPNVCAPQHQTWVLLSTKSGCSSAPKVGAPKHQKWVLLNTKTGCA